MNLLIVMTTEKKIKQSKKLTNTAFGTEALTEKPIAQSAT
jgi:hypothetical protein